jgi:hypothetical protein
VADEIGIGRMFSSVAAAVTCRLMTKNIEMQLPRLIVSGMTLRECVNMVQNDYYKIISDVWKSYSLQRLNSLPSCHVEI